VNPFKVFIPTTRGAVQVLSITREAPDIRSVLCIEGSFEALPVSSRYEQFVRRPTGVIEKLLGEGSYRTDLDAPVTQGDSWQLGILCAHVLDGSTLFSGTRERRQAGRTIWASGEVSPALEVRPVDHMRQKFTESLAILQGLHDGGEQITVLLHPSNSDEIADLIPDSWTVIAATTIHHALAGIGVEISASSGVSSGPSSGSSSGAAQDQLQPGGRRWDGLALGGGILLLALGLIAYHLPVQALKNALHYEQAGQHRALLMEIRTSLARKNWVVTNAFYFFEVFYLGGRAQALSEALRISISTDGGMTEDGMQQANAGPCGKALFPSQQVGAVFPMLPGASCPIRLSVENSYPRKVRVWLAVTGEGNSGTPTVAFRSGADLQPGDRFETPPFVATNDNLSLYAVVSDRPDFGWRQWFENLIQAPVGVVQQANIDRLAASGIGVIVARQPPKADLR
jgi:hypothetical protein